MLCLFFVSMASKSFDDSSSASEEEFPLLVGAFPKISGNPSMGLSGGARVFLAGEEVAGAAPAGARIAWGAAARTWSAAAA